MLKTNNTVLYIVDAVVNEFNAHRYRRLGSVLTLDRQDLFHPTRLHIEVSPYSLYRKSCLFLAARHSDQHEHDTLPPMFGLEQSDFQKELASIEKSLNSAQSPIVPVLSSIAARAGLSNAIERDAMIQTEAQRLTEEPGYKEALLDKTFAALIKRYEENKKTQDVETSSGNVNNAPKDALSPKRLSIKDVVKSVVAVFNELNITATQLTYDQIIGQNRMQDIALCRHFAMYAVKQSLPRDVATMPLIGREFGKRDHTTVYHSVCKIADQILANDAKTLSILNAVSERLRLSPSQHDSLLSGKKVSIKNWSELESETPEAVPVCTPEIYRP